MRARASRWGCSFRSSPASAAFSCSAEAREESVCLRQEKAPFSGEAPGAQLVSKPFVSEQGADAALAFEHGERASSRWQREPLSESFASERPNEDSAHRERGLPSERFASEHGAAAHASESFASGCGEESAARWKRGLPSEGAGTGTAPKHRAVRMAAASAIRAPSARTAMTAPAPSRMGRIDSLRAQRPPRMNSAAAAGRNRQRNAEKKSTLPMVEMKPSMYFCSKRG